MSYSLLHVYFPYNFSAYIYTYISYIIYVYICIYSGSNIETSILNVTSYIVIKTNGGGPVFDTDPPPLPRLPRACPPRARDLHTTGVPGYLVVHTLCIL